MKQVHNLTKSNCLLCLVWFHCVVVCALPVLDSELNLNPLDDRERFSSLSVPITPEPRITRAGRVPTDESYAADQSPLNLINSSIKENLESKFRSQVVHSHESDHQKEEKEEEEESEEEEEEELKEGAAQKYEESHVKGEEDEEKEEEEEEAEEKYEDFDDEDYEDLYAAEFEDEYDKHHPDHHHDYDHDHGHMDSHVDIHGHEQEQGHMQTNSHDCGYFHHPDEHSVSMDHHFPTEPRPPPPPEPPTTPLPIKGSIDYVLIPMILIGIFGPVFTFMFVLLGCIETKLPLPTSRSITLEDAPYRNGALDTDFDGQNLMSSVYEAVKSTYENYDGCSQKLVCTTTSFARRWNLIDADPIPQFSSGDFLVKHLPRTVRRHFRAFKWSLNNPNADCDVFKCQLSLS